MKNLQSFEEHLNEAKLEYSSQDVTKMYLDLSKQWQAKLDKYLKGKTITTLASKHSDKGHSWKEHTISNIKEVKISSYFGTDLNVKSDDGEWYSLLKD
jgi:hypothetical protein